MRLFTLDEAENLLPQIRARLEAMRAARRELDLLREELEHAIGPSSGNGHVRDEMTLSEKRRRAEALVDDINGGLRAFNALGVELKGLDEGLIDFPSERAGRVVYLCWKLGEDGIAWWHEIDSGFAGRQPL